MHQKAIKIAEEIAVTALHFITLKTEQAFFNASSDPKNPQAKTGVRISER